MGKSKESLTSKNGYIMDKCDIPKDIQKILKPLDSSHHLFATAAYFLSTQHKISYGGGKIGEIIKKYAILAYDSEADKTLYVVGEPKPQMGVERITGMVLYETEEEPVVAAVEKEINEEF